MRVIGGFLLLLCLSGVSVSAQGSLVADANNTFRIDSNTNTAAWRFVGSPDNNPTLNMTAGTTYWFSIEANTAASPPHPFGLNFDGTPAQSVAELGLIANSTTCTGTATSGYQSTGSCKIQFTPTATTPTKILYRCAFHPAMVGQINVAGGGAATGAPTTGAPTTGAPTTGAPTGATGAPTTPAPGGATNPPGGGSASLIPGLAVMFAALVGLAANH